MWLARDANGKLNAYKINDIYKSDTQWCFRKGADNSKDMELLTYYELRENLFSKITWEDSKPHWIRLIKPDWVVKVVDY